MKMESKIKNVIIVCDHMHVAGGASKIAIQTAISLKNNGLNVIYFGAVSPIDKDLTNSGVVAICTGQSDITHQKSHIKAFFQGINNKKAKKTFSKLLEEFDIQDTIIHVHGWTKALSSSIFIPLKRKNYRVLITVHDYFLICPNGGLFNYNKSEICNLKPLSLRCKICNCDSRGYLYKVYRIIRQQRQRKILNKMHNISLIFISEFSKQQFLKRVGGLSETKTYYLQNPIQIPEIRERVCCEKNNRYVFIGAVQQAKGIERFCAAVTIAGVKAMVIGDGPLKEKLQKQYKNIQFIGWKDKQEIDGLIQEARCLIFPSLWYEASPLTPIEVMAWGVPIICSDLNAAKDIIINRETGLLYDGTSTESLVQAIDKARDDAFICAMSKTIFDNFNVQAYLLDVYKKKAC